VRTCRAARGQAGRARARRRPWWKINGSCDESAGANEYRLSQTRGGVPHVHPHPGPVQEGGSARGRRRVDRLGGAREVEGGGADQRGRVGECRLNTGGSPPRGDGGTWPSACRARRLAQGRTEDGAGGTEQWRQGRQRQGARRDPVQRFAGPLVPRQHLGEGAGPVEREGRRRPRRRGCRCPCRACPPCPRPPRRPASSSGRARPRARSPPQPTGATAHRARPLWVVAAGRPRPPARDQQSAFDRFRGDAHAVEHTAHGDVRTVAPEVEAGLLPGGRGDLLGHVGDHDDPGPAGQARPSSARTPTPAVRGNSCPPRCPGVLSRTIPASRGARAASGDPALPLGVVGIRAQHGRGGARGLDKRMRRVAGQGVRLLVQPVHQ
jgi:hypothetical protein